MADETNTSTARADAPQMPADTIVPGEIGFAMQAERPEFAHALGRRIRSGAEALPVDQVAGMAHAVGQLLEALRERSQRITELEDAADEARELLEQHEERASQVAHAVKSARRKLAEVEKQW